MYRKWVKRGEKHDDHDKVPEVQNSTNSLIRQAKQTYYVKLGNILSNPQTGQKNFWPAFKRMTNKKNILIFRPLLITLSLLPIFNIKLIYLTTILPTNGNIYDNGSTLLEFCSKTNASISLINITTDQIIAIIKKYNANKAHGHDGISVAMLQICAAEVAIPFDIIFRKCVSTGMFPDSWKFANVQPIHKKGNRKHKSNYRPISLLPICGKILEKIIFDQVYSFLNTNKLISKHQSGFRPGDSTIYQLISMTSDIYESFEKYDETRALFLDISKAFDKVWHNGIIFKLKCNGISGNLLRFLENYLRDRFQRVVLNGTTSNWRGLNVGVPQGSVLGPLLFLIYINNLTDNISSQMRLFADDSSIFTRVEGVDQTQVKIIKDLQTVSDWAHQWKMVFNPDITKQAIEVIFSVKKNKPDHPELIFNDIPVARQDHTKHLGVFLDSRLNFSKHIKEAIIKAKKGISLLKYLSKYVSRNVLDTCYKLYVRPHLDYGDVIYHIQRADLMNLIEQVQYKAALIVSRCWQGMLPQII